MTDSIKLIEEGLAPLIERIRSFEFTENNEHSKEELNRIIKCIEELPTHTEDELNALLEYVKLFPIKIEKEINLAIRNFQRLPLHSQEDIDTFYIYLKSKGVSKKIKKGIIDFVRRITLIKYLNFIDKIKHLEKESQEQLIVLTNIIRKYIPSCSMIVLFGSYARGTAVRYDEYIDENGSRLSYQSDFDMMVVLPSPATAANAHKMEGRICSKIKDEYNQKFLGRLHTPPQFVVECEEELCKNLEIHQPFFSDIIKEGILLYTDRQIYLSEPKELLYKIKKELAQKHFAHLYYPDKFLKIGKSEYKEEDYVTASFMLHQSCENYYRDMSMVFINYSPKLHDLTELIEKAKDFSPELLTVFPRVTDFEKKVFKLLRDAYVDARYKLDFVVTKEELEYMLERTEILKEITYRICQKRIEYYDQKSKEE